MRNKILRNKIFDTIQNKIPKDLYNRLLNMKRRLVEEDTKLRENMIKKLCDVNTDEDTEIIFKGIEPLLRNKRRGFLLKGGNNEEIKKETEKAIVSYMTYMSKVTKESVQLEKASLVYVEGSTPTDVEVEVKETEIIESPPHIVIGTKSIQVDSTYIIVDDKENPFTKYGTNTVGNITTYSSYDEEDDVEEEKRSERKEEYRGRVKKERKKT